MTQHLKRRIAAIFLVLTLILSQSISCCFAATTEKGKEFVKDIYFEWDNEDVKDYVPENINIEGKHYRPLSYDIELFSSPIKKKKTVKSKKKKIPDYITKNVNGEAIKLYPILKNISWENASDIVTQEYAAGAEIPETIEHEGNTLTKKSVTPSTKIADVSTEAVFTTNDVESDQFYFNGKKVMLQNGEPKWNGYLKDMAEYLGVDGSKVYTVTGSYWKGPFKEKNGIWTRTAVITGTKLINIQLADYQQDDGDIYYMADVEFRSKYIGHATVTYERYFTTLQKFIYAGVGIFILAALVCLILFFVKKRRREDEE